MEKVVTLAIPVYFISIFIEAFLSHKFKKNYYNLKDSLGNLGTGIIMQMRELLTKSSIILMYSWIVDHVGLNQLPWTEDFSSLQGKISWVLAFIMTDFIYYLFHRHSHEINILWSGHIVHHSSEEYNLSVALRQSAIQGLFFCVYLIPLALLGIPAKLVFGCYGLNLIYQFFIHTRFVGKLGILEGFLNTPSHHRVHHARQGKYLDCNYAGVFIIWDKWFGTFIEEEEEPKYGIYPRFQSYNSVKANLMPLQEMLRYFFQSNNIQEKINVFFKGPLWTFERFKKGKKLNILATNSKVDLQVFSLFLLALGFALVGLFNKELTLIHQIIVTSLVVVILALVGRKLDRSVN